MCLHHFDRGNTRGARKLFSSSARYLDAYRPWHLGVDLERLLCELGRCCGAVLAAEDLSPSVTLDPALLPRIHFVETCEG